MPHKFIVNHINELKHHPILVVGDVMLDEFHWCEVTRISPEAPVPICKVLRTTLVPGGASNVALNIKKLSNTPLLYGIIGKDSTAQKLEVSLKENHIDIKGLLQQNEKPTILKSRIIAHQQQVARVDREETSPISENIENDLIRSISNILPSSKAIVLSDYLKGTLTDTCLKTLITKARELTIPVVIDPKGSDYKKYQNAHVLTPNFSEFQAAVKSPVNTEEQIADEGFKLIESLKLDALVITRSEKGMTILTHKKERKDIPTRAKEVYDITGAGDTVIATLALALSSNWSIFHAAELANVAAGIVVGKLGTATTTLNEIEEYIHKHDML